MATREIGVVVPTWNSAATLDWTLCSLKHQKDCNVQIIVADSGSTDGTLDICRRWDVPTVYEPPGSMYRAINAGSRQLKTPWLAYVNSDDLMYSDAYMRLIDLGEQEKADVVYGDGDFIDAAGRFLFEFHAASPKLVAALTEYGTIAFTQPSGIYRKEVFDSLDGYRPDFRFISDFDFYSRAIRAGKKFVALPRPSVTAFRLMPSQLHQREAVAMENERGILKKEGKIRDGGKLLTLQWRLKNLTPYLMRYLRKGSLKMRH